MAPVRQFDFGPSGHKSRPATILYKHNQNDPSDGSFRKRSVAVFINCEDGYGGDQKRACEKCRQAQQILNERQRRTTGAQTWRPNPHG